MSGAATGALIADEFNAQAKKLKRPAGFMTRFMHNVMPEPKTPELRGKAVLEELSKLHPEHEGREKPDYDYVAKLLDKGVAGPDADLLEIGKYLVNERENDLLHSLLDKTKDFPIDMKHGKRELTLLHRAVLLGHVGAVDRLMVAGANPEIPDIGGDTPRAFAGRDTLGMTLSVVRDVIERHVEQRMKGAAKTAPAARAGRP